MKKTKREILEEMYDAGEVTPEGHGLLKKYNLHEWQNTPKKTVIAVGSTNEGTITVAEALSNLSEIMVNIDTYDDDMQCTLRVNYSVYENESKEEYVSRTLENMKMHEDPDYAKYLELKEKYEGPIS